MIKEAEKFCDMFDNPIMPARISLSNSKALYHLGELSDAIDCVDEGIELFQDLGDKFQLANLFILKANILIDKKKLKKVEKSLDKAKKYIRKLTDPNLTANYESTLKKYESLI